jgi:hypothetical protein
MRFPFRRRLKCRNDLSICGFSCGLNLYRAVVDSEQGCSPQTTRSFITIRKGGLKRIIPKTLALRSVGAIPRERINQVSQGPWMSLQPELDANRWTSSVETSKR